jgi:hypothetical protein
MKEKYVMEDIKWWEEQPKLWQKYVPASGQADSVQGELIRCTGKVADEAYRNGNINWESGFERLVRYVGEKLNDPDTFSTDEIKKISDAVESIVRDFDSPDISGYGSPYYFLTEMAVRWCLANPEPIPHDKDPSLKI